MISLRMACIKGREDQGTGAMPLVTGQRVTPNPFKISNVLRCIIKVKSGGTIPSILPITRLGLVGSIRVTGLGRMKVA